MYKMNMSSAFSFAECHGHVLMNYALMLVSLIAIFPKKMYLGKGLHKFYQCEKLDSNAKNKEPIKQHKIIGKEPMKQHKIIRKEPMKQHKIIVKKIRVQIFVIKTHGRLLYRDGGPAYLFQDRILVNRLDN